MGCLGMSHRHIDMGVDIAIYTVVSIVIVSGIDICIDIGIAIDSIGIDSLGNRRSQIHSRAHRLVPCVDIGIDTGID
eukprot:9194311-Alexandrium_andersonii.AAC.1